MNNETKNLKTDPKAVDVLAALDMCIECFGSTEECPDDTACIDEIKQARAAVAELQRLVLAIDAECGNSKPDFAKVCALASEAAALSK